MRLCFLWCRNWIQGHTAVYIKLRITERHKTYRLQWHLRSVTNKSQVLLSFDSVDSSCRQAIWTPGYRAAGSHVLWACVLPVIRITHCILFLWCIWNSLIRCFEDGICVTAVVTTFGNACPPLRVEVHKCLLTTSHESVDGLVPVLWIWHGALSAHSLNV